MDTVYGEMGNLGDDVAGTVRLSIRALIGGVLAALASQLLLMVLGAAIGLTAFEPSGAVMKGVGIGFSIWLILSLCVSTFLGAWVTTALARRCDRRSGLLQGLVLWGAVSCVGAWMIGGAVGSLMSGAAGLMGTAAQSPAVNRQLGGGTLRREIDRATNAARDATNSPQARAQAGETADQAATGAAVGSWGLFIAMALSLISALFGGAAAASREGHLVGEALAPRRRVVPATSTTTPGTGPLPPAPTPTSPY